MWLTKSLYFGLWDLTVMTLVFAALALRGYCKWK